MTSQTENTLQEAGNLRESEKFSEAIRVYTDTLIHLLEEQDYTGLVHCLCGQSLTYKILARKTNETLFKSLTSAFAKEALFLLEQHQEQVDSRTQSIALSTYADSLLMENKPADALPYFEKSLSISPADIPEKGRLRAHIGKVKFLLGDKQDSLRLINSALEDIRSGDQSTYAIRVWETGALNDLSKIYALEGDLESAKKFNQDSLAICKTHNLAIRLKEAQAIEAKLLENKTDFLL